MATRARRPAIVSRFTLAERRLHRAKIMDYMRKINILHMYTSLCIDDLHAHVEKENAAFESIMADPARKTAVSDASKSARFMLISIRRGGMLLAVLRFSGQRKLSLMGELCHLNSAFRRFLNRLRYTFSDTKSCYLIFCASAAYLLL
jgi:hypothetical protein